MSLLYPDNEVRLAPLYDVISTIYYPDLNTDMAMRIGREYSSHKVTPKASRLNGLATRNRSKQPHSDLRERCSNARGKAYRGAIRIRVMGGH